MTVVAPPTLPCASFFACSGVSLSFTADIIVSLETQRAKPPNSLSNTYSFILVSDSPAAALRSSPRCFDFGMAHCCCSRLPGRWLAQLFPRTRGRGNGSGGGDLTFAPSLKAPLHGVWSHFFWRAPNVFSRIWCLDGEHCCTHLIVSVHLKVTYGLQALVDAGRKLRLPFSCTFRTLVTSSHALRCLKVSSASFAARRACFLASPNGRTLARHASTLSCCSSSSTLQASPPNTARSCVELRESSASKATVVEEISLEAFGSFQCHWLHAQDARLRRLLFVIVSHESGAGDLWANHKNR